MAKLVIFGAGDIARLAHHYFSTDSRHEVVAFAVDASHRKAKEFRGRQLMDAEELTRRYPPGEFRMFCALSYAKMNTVRESKVAMARQMGYELVSYISSRSSWLTDAPAGDNCFILEDNTI